MKILIVLTYYRPHTSGLTIYTERLAKALAELGNDVTVFTTQYDRSLPREEVSDGVRIFRSPVLFRISKGVVSPLFGYYATKLVLENDVIHLHLPQFDAAGVALRARLFGKPSVITYHCDLQLPPGLFNRIVNQIVHLMNNLAAWFTDKVITYTRDYADHSPYTHRYLAKVGIIQPPVELPSTNQDSIDHFRTQYQLMDRGPVIGLAARFAAEKGIEVLLDSIPAVIEKFPKAVILFAGQYKNVLGEDSYANRLFPIIEKYIQEGHWEWLGVLDQQKMAAFYKNLDVLTVPSLNSTESFGLVQIEAMMNDVPVVASNLPGVRQPVMMTGMGEIAEIGDSISLSECLIKVLSNRNNYRVDHNWIENHFSPRQVAQEYLNLYQQLLDTKE